ncbi:MAG: hypothetical protein BGP05_02565 [Rhizobiales bacterium 62-47]|nr:MAG: hypothetical protein BGP05_02565 [Rhizobiales bacterium 62-47]
MLAVLYPHIFDGLGAADEHSAIDPVLFLGDPLSRRLRPMNTTVEMELHEGGSTNFTGLILLIGANPCSPFAAVRLSRMLRELAAGVL